MTADSDTLQFLSPSFQLGSAAPSEQNRGNEKSQQNTEKKNKLLNNFHHIFQVHQKDSGVKTDFTPSHFCYTHVNPLTFNKLPVKSIFT